jgi:hypothetical protein
VFKHSYITLEMQEHYNTGHHISCVSGMREGGFSGIIVELVRVYVSVECGNGLVCFPSRSAAFTA